MRKLSALLSSLLLLPCCAFADVQTGSDVGYGDGKISSGKLSLVSENAYFGGMLGNWQSGRSSNESFITGFLVGYKTRGDVYLDMAMGGYDELAADRMDFNNVVGRLNNRSHYPLMGSVNVGFRLNPSMILDIGGLYLQRPGETSIDNPIFNNRLMGKASVTVSFK